MKIVIPTIGSRGDVQPYIALALGLQAAGYEVTVATHPCLRALVTSYGVPFASMGPDIDIGHETALIRERAAHWLVGFMRVMRFTFAMLEQSYKDLLALSRSADLMIVSHSGAGSIEADKVGRPTVSVTLFPQAIPVSDPTQPAIRRTLGKLAGAGMGLFMSRPLNRIRRRVGVPPMGPTGITSPRLNLIPISPHVFPPDPLWEPRHRLTGYWFADQPQTWTPPAELLSFLEAGDPPVVVSLGAMALSGADAMEAARITLSAVQEAGVRAIIQGWDEPMAMLKRPSTVYHADALPHDWLLQRAAAMVHHGGFGTTAAALRAGIPAIVIPHIIDQFMWGERVYKLGAGPKPIPRSRLTVSELAAALVQATQDEIMCARSAGLGDAIRAEDGVARAVELIRQCDLQQAEVKEAPL